MQLGVEAEIDDSQALSCNDAPSRQIEEDRSLRIAAHAAMLQVSGTAAVHGRTVAARRNLRVLPLTSPRDDSVQTTRFRETGAVREPKPQRTLHGAARQPRR